jgi:hypothetical protein
MLGKERALAAVRISLGAITTSEAIDSAIVGFRRVLGAGDAVR